MRLTLVLLVVLGLASLSMPAGSAASAPTASVAAAQTATPERLTLTPATSGTILEIEARFADDDPTKCEVKRHKPLHARYRGTLSFVLGPDGAMSLVNRLSFEDYLKGLGEMPRSWPIEALRAQVIAARTYALYRMRGTSSRSYDICATDRCQVYRGASVELGAFGERWVRAVESTQARALIYRGRPAAAFYFSTSNGRTRSNAAAFGGSPLPYLRSVRGYDEDAPLAHWQASFRLSDLTAVLRTTGLWRGGAITDAEPSGERVVFRGGGRTLALDRAALRGALNDEAACLFPSRYPGPRPSGGRLPLAVPGFTYTARQDGGSLVLTGRGWGHGVGMSQYGARALAERGRRAGDILSYFYGGLRPGRVSEPGVIRVLAAEKVESVRISVQGRVRATTGTGSRLALGDAFELRGGRRIAVRRGVGPSAAPVLEVGLNTTSVTAPGGETAVVRVVLNRSARVSLALARGESVVARVAETSYESGVHSVSLPLVDGTGAALSPGTYSVTLEAFDGIDRVRSAAIPVTVVGPSPTAVATAAPTRTIAAAPTPRSSGAPVWLIVPAGVAALIVVGAVVARRRRPSRT